MRRQSALALLKNGRVPTSASSGSFRTTVPSHPGKLPADQIERKVQDSGRRLLPRGTLVLAAAFAGEGQLTNSNRAFGQGVAAQLMPICLSATS